MEQKELNMRIAMSLLRQCAWVWEHCTKTSLHECDEGELKLREIFTGYNKKAGYVFIDMDFCEYWDVFNKQQPIEGLTFDRKEMRSTVKIESFSCSFFLRDVFSVTASFCKWNCPSMANKARFCFKDGERWAVLPEVKSAPKARCTKKQKATISRTSSKCSTVSLSIADRLRAALRDRLAA